MATLYDTLGVPMHATDEEIKRAYRKAAMKWHPDRNAGSEDVARAAFQEIRDAYAILSDAAQRKVYDAVYAEQMQQWEAQRARHQKAQAEREAAARAADEAAYAEMVSLAMRFADEGHNRDVLFGVLLGRQCEPARAAQIADSVAALQAARREAAASRASTEEAADIAFDGGADASSPEAVKTGSGAHQTAARGAHATHAQRDRREQSDSEAQPAGGFSTLWFQFLNGLRF
ncbi:J domain-containing protein [Paraburkholderia phenoliruptrix]|uniref:Chaperone protein DnaJ n=2 Tax=Paraburkholderia phenoliruptrix TaxID=252970 RepID=A0A6J5JXF6_9BURK|nr:J domain-containing protein [Paraburkholderia phenoliruptrix]AFT87918.1 heat shock protein DnaJ domain-containing protein [Paraburkholderia phenoliruptrix BR3459a]MDR6418154.1 curved DNA-binding protein CbpA [Paraburkholderia phenoliruptrix]CAB3644200.1 Chaperone protein DnaJ [Paraburkholderia phenoliruptrix]CAB4046823.1 Chaperone protein DnaJ [Paraburkholderia phenoliruptrix]